MNTDSEEILRRAEEQRSLPVVGQGAGGAYSVTKVDEFGVTTIEDHFPPPSHNLVVGPNSTDPGAGKVYKEQPYLVKNPIPKHNKTFGFISIVLPFGGSITPLSLPGNCLYIESITDATLPSTDASGYGITALTSNNELININKNNRRYIFANEFKSVQFTNPNAASAVVNLYIGFGLIDTDGAATTIVGQNCFSRSISFNRPNNVVAYAANQAVAETGGTFLATHTFAAPVARAAGGFFRIEYARIIKGTTNVALANFSLYLYSLYNAALVNDQAAYPMLSSQWVARSNAIINFPTFISGGAGSDSAVCELAGLNIRMFSGSANELYGFLVANAAYVPGAIELFNINLKGSIE